MLPYWFIASAYLSEYPSIRVDIPTDMYVTCRPISITIDEPSNSQAFEHIIGDEPLRIALQHTEWPPCETSTIYTVTPSTSWVTTETDTSGSYLVIDPGTDYGLVGTYNLNIDYTLQHKVDVQVSDSIDIAVTLVDRSCEQTTVTPSDIADVSLMYAPPGRQMVYSDDL